MNESHLCTKYVLQDIFDLFLFRFVFCICKVTHIYILYFMFILRLISMFSCMCVMSLYDIKNEEELNINIIMKLITGGSNFNSNYPPLIA